MIKILKILNPYQNKSNIYSQEVQAIVKLTLKT
jgi:hypothetical protein